MILTIDKWTGRLGNNIVELINMLSIGLYHNHNIRIPYHSFFNKTDIILNKISDNVIYNDKDNFFYTDRLKKDKTTADFDEKCFSENSNLIKEYICKLSTIDWKVLEPLESDSLLIHIRSGDICGTKWIHPLYLPPPISYYINIIKTNKYKKIYMISEDMSNPIISKLLEIYPNIQFSLRTLLEDIKLVLRAPNIIMSIGTFISSLTFLTYNTKNIYCPSYIQSHLNLVKLHEPHIKLHIIDLDNYKKQMGIWKNSSKQREQLLSQ